MSSRLLFILVLLTSLCCGLLAAADGPHDQEPVATRGIDANISNSYRTPIFIAPDQNAVGDDERVPNGTSQSQRENGLATVRGLHPWPETHRSYAQVVASLTSTIETLVAWLCSHGPMITAVATCVLAIFTCLLAKFTYQLVHAERPFLIPEKPTLVGRFPSLAEVDNRDVDPLAATVALRNFGKGPAIIEKAVGRFAFEKQSFLPTKGAPFHCHDLLGGTGTVIGAAESADYISSLEDTIRLTRDQLDEIWNHRKRLIFYGQIRYRDVFRATYDSIFFYAYQPAGGFILKGYFYAPPEARKFNTYT